MDSGIQCQICYMTFTDQSTINAHYETMHDDSARNDRGGAYACDVCGKRMSSRFWLKQHLATTHGVGEATKFECNVCARAFGDRSNLNRHMKRVHHKTSS